MIFRRSKTGERGFTLVEMLVVFTIGALLIAVAAPRMTGSVARVRLRATAQSLAAVLREARSAATRSGEPVVFSLDPAGRAYVFAGRTVLLPAGESVAFRPFAQDAAGGSQPRLEFLPDGTATGGILAVAAGNNHVEVEVDWLSGRISVRE